MVLLKENHTHLTEAETLDRKSGGAEGSAVPRTLPGNVFDRAHRSGEIRGFFSVLSHPLRVAQDVSPISANLRDLFIQNAHKIVILRVCNFIGFEKKLMLKTKGLGASKVAKNQ